MKAKVMDTCYICELKICTKKEENSSIYEFIVSAAFQRFTSINKFIVVVTIDVLLPSSSSPATLHASYTLNSYCHSHLKNFQQQHIESFCHIVRVLHMHRRCRLFVCISWKCDGGNTNILDSNIVCFFSLLLLSCITRFNLEPDCVTCFGKGCFSIDVSSSLDFFSKKKIYCYHFAVIEIHILLFKGIVSTRGCFEKNEKKNCFFYMSCITIWFGSMLFNKFIAIAFNNFIKNMFFSSMIPVDILWLALQLVLTLILIMSFLGRIFKKIKISLVSMAQHLLKL